MAKPSHDTEITLAAVGLAEELERFERFTDSVCSESLRSQKGIERVTKQLQSLPELDAKLTTGLQRLVAAISEARERQSQQANRLQQRAEELRARSSELDRFNEEYQALGRSAGELNTMLSGITETSADGELSVIPERLSEVLARMKAWAENAAELSERAAAADFHDLARSCDSLRQQLLAVRRKAQSMQPASASMAN